MANHCNVRFFPVEAEQEQKAIASVLSTADLSDAIGEYFYLSTKKLINANSYNLVGQKVSGIDIVRQVLTTVPVYWVATDLVRPTCNSE